MFGFRPLWLLTIILICSVFFVLYSLLHLAIMEDLEDVACSIIENIPDQADLNSYNYLYQVNDCHSVLIGLFKCCTLSLLFFTDSLWTFNFWLFLFCSVSLFFSCSLPNLVAVMIMIVWMLFIAFQFDLSITLIAIQWKRLRIFFVSPSPCPVCLFVRVCVFCAYVHLSTLQTDESRTLFAYTVVWQSIQQITNNPKKKHTNIHRHHCILQCSNDRSTW